MTTVTCEEPGLAYLHTVMASNALFSMFFHKCPRCRKGDLFETGSFSFSKPFEMPSRCTECGQTYYPEPGFYYGSMFMSYIITSFFSLGLVGFCILVLGWSVETAFITLLAILGVLFVWFFRTARSVWIHMNVKYQPGADEHYDSAEEGDELPEYVNRNF